MRLNSVSRGSFPVRFSSSALIALGCMSAGCSASRNDAQQTTGGSDSAQGGSVGAAASGGTQSSTASLAGDTAPADSSAGGRTTASRSGGNAAGDGSGDSATTSISAGGDSAADGSSAGDSATSNPAGDSAAAGSSSDGDVGTSSSSGGTTASIAAGGTSAGGAAARGGSSAGGKSASSNSAGGSSANISSGGASNGGQGSQQSNRGGAGGAANGGASNVAGRGGSPAGGAAAGSGGGTGSGSAKCAPTGQIPSGAPILKVGVWTDITPPGIVKGDAQTCIGQGIALDPCNTGTLYWGTTPYDPSKGGLYKSTNGGGTWTKIGQLDEPVHVRVDPKNPNHLYAGDGVRGNTLGFWVSWDGGNNWAKPAGWTDFAAKQKLTIDDVYDIAVDPTDFNHIVVSSHSPYDWDSATYGEAAGVLESKDGGDSWVVHKPKLTWGYGHSIDFLYEPSLGIGDANTWLLGTQENGIWRTTDAGENWTQVSTTSIAHGGDDIYYTKAGVLYAGSASGILRSTDNGKSWTTVKDTGSYSTVGGDGNLLYTGICWGSGATPFLTSPETDGSTWTPFNNGAQTFLDGGPFEIAFDKQNNILYASVWMQGIWALKIK